MKKNISNSKTLAFLGRENKGEANAIGMSRMYNGLMTADDLDAMAGNLSNYGGRSGYTGLGDEFLDFGGGSNGSFADPIQRGKIYNLTIQNTTSGGSAATLTSLLCPGLIYNAQGLIKDGTFVDQGGTAGLTATGSPLQIAYFNAFILYFPTLVAAFKITTSNLSQLEQVITITKQSPFKQHESKIINIAIYASEINPNTSLITVPESFYMDNQTQITYPILAGTTVNVGLIFGTSLSLAKALRTKTETAAKNIKMAAYSGYRGR